MTEHERYLFDLQGFIVVPNALNPQQVAELIEGYRTTQVMERRTMPGSNSTAA